MRSVYQALSFPAHREPGYEANTTSTSKISNDVHLGYMQVTLSTNFPIKTCKFAMIIFLKVDDFWGTTL